MLFLRSQSLKHLLFFLFFFIPVPDPIFLFKRNFRSCSAANCFAVHYSLVRCAVGFFWLFRRSVPFLSRPLRSTPRVLGSSSFFGFSLGTDKRTCLACLCVCVCVQELTVAEGHTVFPVTVHHTTRHTRTLLFPDTLLGQRPPRLCAVLVLWYANCVCGVQDL